MLSLTVRTSWMGFRLVLSSHSSVYRTSRNYCKTVYFSKSNDVFTNLALEDWFYRNTNFEKNNLLLLWINKPCVVIGRHQNPWAEVNFSQLSQHGIQFSRRNSGGGTVYHDNGNLNCTFFSTRLRYNRKQNLELICKALTKEWNLNVEVSPREDIILDQKYKISGTASKLGNKVAYHHCTLLINVDTSKLLQALDVTDLGVLSKATPSVRSKTRNLSEDTPSMTVDNVSAAIGNHFLGLSSSTPDLFHFIEPNEQNFPGLEALRNEFSSWQWIYGKTPQFSVRWPLEEDNSVIDIQVKKGVIEGMNFTESSFSATDMEMWSDLLLNQQLSQQLYHQINNSQLKFSDEDANSRMKELLLGLCSITL